MTRTQTQKRIKREECRHERVVYKGLMRNEFTGIDYKLYMCKRCGKNMGARTLKKLRTKKVKIHVEAVKALISKRRRINRYDFDKIIWCEGGKELNIPKEIIEEFKSTGLNNMDFVETEFYNTGLKDNKYIKVIQNGDFIENMRSATPEEQKLLQDFKNEHSEFITINDTYYDKKD